MKLQIEDLSDLEPIDKVIIHSIDWMIYQVTVSAEGEDRLLYQGNSPFRCKNLLEIQEIFQPIHVEYFGLRRPNNAYDEMVGQTTSVFLDSFEIPLPWKKVTVTTH